MISRKVGKSGLSRSENYVDIRPSCSSVSTYSQILIADDSPWEFCRQRHALESKASWHCTHQMRRREGFDETTEMTQIVLRYCDRADSIRW